MDVLFVGLGSIGTRHLKNLHAVAAQKDIPVRAWALRSSARALPEETRALLALLTLLLGSVIGLIYHFTRQSLVKESRDIHHEPDAPAFRDVTKSAGQSGYSFYRKADL